MLEDINWLRVPGYSAPYGMILLGSSIMLCGIALLVAVKILNDSFIPLFLISVPIGAIPLTYGATNLLRARQREEMARLNPGKPWMRYPCWQSNTITSYEGKKTLRRIMVAIAAVPTMAALLFMILYVAMPIILKIFSGFLVLFLLVSVVESIAQIFRYLIYGESELEMKQMPAVPGSEFAGRIFLPEKVKIGDIKLNLLLNQIHCPVKHDELKLVYQEVKTVRSDPKSVIKGRRFIEFSFEIPGDAKTTDLCSYPKFFWWLVVSAASDNIDYKTSFFVPVYEMPVKR